MAKEFYINENLVDKGTDLFYKNRSVLTSLGLGQIVYVSAAGGVDATGLVGRIDRPFKTIQAGCNAAGYNTHVIVMEGTYNESVTTPNTFSTGTIEYLPGVTHTYGENDDKYTMTVASERIKLIGRDWHRCFINRTGTNTGGAVSQIQYWGAFAKIEGFTINSTGTGVAVKNTNYLKNCYIYTTGGDGVGGNAVPSLENCVVISTVGHALNLPGKPSLYRCFIKGNLSGITMNNPAGLNATDSTIIGVTGYGYYGTNYNGSSRIENCFIKGFTRALYLGTYNYGDPSVHLIRNTILITDDPAVNFSAYTFFLMGQNIIANKPMQNYLPVLEQAISIVDNPNLTPDLHGINEYDIYQRNI